MPVLILLGIGTLCGIVALVDQQKPSQKYVRAGKGEKGL